MYISDLPGIHIADISHEVGNLKKIQLILGIKEGISYVALVICDLLVDIVIPKNFVDWAILVFITEVQRMPLTFPQNSRHIMMDIDDLLL